MDHNLTSVLEGQMVVGAASFICRYVQPSP